MILMHDEAEVEAEQPVVFQEEHIAAITSERYESRRNSVPEAPAIMKSNLVSMHTLPDMVEDDNIFAYDSNQNSAVHRKRSNSTELQSQSD